MTYCPNPKCSSLIRIINTNYKLNSEKLIKTSHNSNQLNSSLVCTNPQKTEINMICPVCGIRFCFQCLGQPHWPCSCVNAMMFKEIVENPQIIFERRPCYIAQIKHCPSCSLPFEIDNTPRCRNQVYCPRCFKFFCRKCLGTYPEHNSNSWKCSVRSFSASMVCNV